MVAQSDISRATALNQELTNIRTALHSFDREGRIVRMTVVAPTVPPVLLDTTAMDYPSQMVAAIRAALSARETAINQELAKMGVTLEEPPPWPEPVPEPEPEPMQAPAPMQAAAMQAAAPAAEPLVPRRRSRRSG